MGYSMLSISAPKVLQKYSKSTPKVPQKYSIDSFHPCDSRINGVLHWSTFGVLLEYFWSTFGTLLDNFTDVELMMLKIWTLKLAPREVWEKIG